MKERRVYFPAEHHLPTQAERVFACVFGQESSTEALARQIRTGVSVRVVVRLQRELGIGREAVLALVQMSASTFRRRCNKANGGGRLTPEESGRVYRIVRLVQDAERLFNGDYDAARNWLKTPVKALGGLSPLDYADNEAAADAVRDVIGRLEYGVVT